MPARSTYSATATSSARALQQMRSRQWSGIARLPSTATLTHSASLATGIAVVLAWKEITHKHSIGTTSLPNRALLRRSFASESATPKARAKGRTTSRRCGGITRPLSSITLEHSASLGWSTSKAETITRQWCGFARLPNRVTLPHSIPLAAITQ
eukprot:Mycagemm_TRINITY_DN10305_c3_g2::TRINITY_DN10305_c3_g2_i2::g.1307::m.1307 type:complete len:154 gc:universal TRINITY_DN10305_c3_g2_i2:851-390(-)